MVPDGCQHVNSKRVKGDDIFYIFTLREEIICERNFCVRNFCGIYFCDFGPYSQK